MDYVKVLVKNRRDIRIAVDLAADISRQFARNSSSAQSL